MDPVKLRAWWSHIQGLDGSLAGATPSEVLARSGWARSVGGVGPYLTLFSRAGTSRHDADQALAQLEIHELPAARGCTYMVARDDFALALTVGQPFDESSMKTAYKLSVTDKEIDKLSAAVLKALANGPLDPEGIRAATDGAARNLGEEGKKKGLTTTVPLALGRLQSSGQIRRIPTNGRLDQQRYLYALWSPNPRKDSRLDADQAYLDLAKKFFRWVGPATVNEFQWFSGLGVKASKSAVEPLGLVPFESNSDRLMFADDLKALLKFRAPIKPQYVLVSSLDAIHATRRDVVTLLDEADLKRKVFVGDKAAAVGELTDLPNHAILDRGRLIGLWDYDPNSESIVWTTFGVKDRSLETAVRRTETFIRDELGDARSFSLDSPKSRVPRIEALKRAARA